MQTTRSRKPIGHRFQGELYCVEVLVCGGFLYPRSNVSTTKAQYVAMAEIRRGVILLQ